MRKKDVNIIETLMNIILVTGILIFIGSINQIVTKGMGGSVYWLVAGFALIAVSIALKVIYNKYRLKKANKEVPREESKDTQEQNNKGNQL